MGWYLRNFEGSRAEVVSYKKECTPFLFYRNYFYKNHYFLITLVFFYKKLAIRMLRITRLSSDLCISYKKRNGVVWSVYRPLYILLFTKVMRRDGNNLLVPVRWVVVPVVPFRPPLSLRTNWTFEMHWVYRIPYRLPYRLLVHQLDTMCWICGLIYR